MYIIQILTPEQMIRRIYPKLRIDGLHLILSSGIQSIVAIEFSESSFDGPDRIFGLVELFPESLTLTHSLQPSEEEETLTTVEVFFPRWTSSITS